MSPMVSTSYRKVRSSVDTLVCGSLYRKSPHSVLSDVVCRVTPSGGRTHVGTRVPSQSCCCVQKLFLKIRSIKQTQKTDKVVMKYKVMTTEMPGMIAQFYKS